MAELSLKSGFPDSEGQSLSIIAMSDENSQMSMSHLGISVRMHSHQPTFSFSPTSFFNRAYLCAGNTSFENFLLVILVYLPLKTKTQAIIGLLMACCYI